MVCPGRTPAREWPVAFAAHGGGQSREPKLCEPAERNVASEGRETYRDVKCVASLRAAVAAACGFGVPERHRHAGVVDGLGGRWCIL